MPTYTVYVKKEEHEKLLLEAKSMGIAPRNLIRKLFENGMSKRENNPIETKIDALFFMLELLIAEMGYTSGATRAASANIPAAVSKGNELELGLKKMIAQLKTHLKKQGAEVKS